MSDSMDLQVKRQNRDFLRSAINELRCVMAVGDYSSISIEMEKIEVGRMEATSLGPMEQRDAMSTEEFTDKVCPSEGG